MACRDCGGVGWRAVHDSSCDGDCRYCPVQEPCERCLGTGDDRPPCTCTISCQGERALEAEGTDRRCRVVS